MLPVIGREGYHWAPCNERSFRPHGQWDAETFLERVECCAKFFIQRYDYKIIDDVQRSPTLIFSSEIIPCGQQFIAIKGSDAR
jgi:hypothetical protein